MNLREEEILYAYITTQCSSERDILLTNHYHGGWEADFLCINPEGITHEIEVKCSKSDFKNDFKKSFVDDQTKISHYKHDRIAKGDYPYNHFSFLLPMGMISHDEIPKHCGIIEYYHNVDDWRTDFYSIRKPTLLHSKNLWELTDKDSFFRKMAMQLLYRKFELKSRTRELILKNQKFL